MTITSQAVNYAGNVLTSDGHRISFDSMTNANIPGTATSHPSWTAGTGAPTFAAAQGSIYSRLDGSSTATRLYVASATAGTWIAVTTAS